MSGACQYRDELRGSNRATELSSCGLSSFSRLWRRVSILANKRGALSLKMPSCSNHCRGGLLCPLMRTHDAETPIQTHLYPLTTHEVTNQPGAWVGVDMTAIIARSRLG